MRGTWRGVVGAALVLAAASGLGACGDDDDVSSAPTAESEADGGEADGAALVAVVEASKDAENAGDAEAFLALWTDKGLEQYDSGTREEIISGEGSFGEAQITIVDVGEPEIDGDTGSVVVDATVAEDGQEPFVVTVFRVVFHGVLDGDEWKLDGFEFQGSPPPADDADVVTVTASEFEFVLDKETATGDVAFRFVNEGEEQHEITLYKAPESVTLEEAKTALEHVDGENLDTIPDGYEVAHIGFADVGQESDITFAEPMEPGQYVLACYIPEGGFGEEGPVNPDGAPHIELGMLALLTVE